MVDALSTLPRLRLRDVELLVAIHAHKSVTAAASELGFTQPAASRALRDIEQLLRVHVFDRDRAKGMRLTAAGELVLTRARALVAEVRSLGEDLDAYRAGTGGHLHLGIIPFVSGPLIERLLAELIGDRVAVTVTEGPTTRLVEELRMERLDAVIGRCSSGPLPAGLVQEIVMRQEGCLVVHAQNPLTKMERIKLAHLEGFAWLLPPQGTPTRTAINEVFAKAKLAPPVATVEASSIKIIHLTVRANPHVLSIVPSDAGHDIQRLGGVRRLPFPVPLHIPPIGLVFAARHRDTPMVRTLRSRLRELVRRKPAS
jgi:DNA-binding transcriptional LysR family regulator